MSFLKKSTPLFFVFIFINILIRTSEKYLASLNISDHVLMFSNLFFLSITLLSIAIQEKALKNKNPNVFIRSVMTGMIIKMFSTAIAVFIYFFQSGSDFNKRGVFVSLFFYLIYLATEVITVMKLNKKSNA